MRLTSGRQVAGAVIISLWLFTPWAQAGDDNVSDQSGHRDQTGFVRNIDKFISYISSSNRWENWHDGWTSNVVSAAEYLDNYFGDDRLEQESNNTRIKISLGVKLTEAEGPALIPRASLRLSLPRLSDRLQLVVDDFLDDEDATVTTIDKQNETTKGAALRYSIQKKKRTNVDLDLGVRLEAPPQLFLRLRGSYTYEVTDTIQWRAIEAIKWYTSDGFVSQSEYQWNWQVRPDWLLRSSSQLEWREDTDGVRPSQVFSAFKSLTSHRAVRIDVGATWPESPTPTDRLYYTTVSFRRRIHSNWLFMELKPGVEFAQDMDYDPQLTFVIQFDTMIGNIQ